MSPLSAAAGPGRDASTTSATLVAEPVRRRPTRHGEPARARPPSRPVALLVEIERDRPAPLVQVSGELDLAGAALLGALIDDVRSQTVSPRGHRPQRIQVDLTRVTFADSHGLAPILDGDVAVRSASPYVRRVLRLLMQPAHGGARRRATRAESTTDDDDRPGAAAPGLPTDDDRSDQPLGSRRA